MSSLLPSPSSSSAPLGPKEEGKRIGIPVHFQYSIFSSGSSITSIALAELFSQAGHTVEFIRVGENLAGPVGAAAGPVGAAAGPVGAAEWWDDCKSLKSAWNSIPLTALAGRYDYIIELDTILLTKDQRVSSGAKHVWLTREPPILHDIEASLYPITPALRDLGGVHAIWIYEEFSSSDDVQYLELLTGIPVRRIPFFWSPLAVEVYKKEANLPPWRFTGNSEWSIHICETNRSSCSSSIIPLLITREIRHKTMIPLKSDVKVHNAETVKDAEFFQKNTLAHIFSDSAPLFPVMVGRQRIADFVHEANSVVIAHSRFIPVRPYVLDAVWMGIPIVHNSPLLSDIYPAGYYPNNSIHDARLAFEKVLATSVQQGQLNSIRKKLLETYSPMATRVKSAWNAALDTVGVVSGTTVLQLSTPGGRKPVTLTAPVTIHVPASSPSSSPSPPFPSPSSDKPVVRVGFCDMWSEFNPEYNAFTLMLESLGNVRVVGFPVTRAQGAPMNFLIFGPFGDTWKTIDPTVPKVHYTGENTGPILREDVKLNLGFKHLDVPAYIRLPLWMLEVDWFNADTDRIQNPKPIPLELCTRTFPSERQKFCAFVVSNPCQPVRNEAFHWMNEYKPVDSAGRLFNTMGPSLFAGLGGGGGELRKLEFLKSYKFCLSYENMRSPGYTTEKLLHAKAAGCIPIYWGDPEVARDFNMDGFIDASKYKKKEELIAAVKEVDSSPSLYSAMYSTPLLDAPRVEAARETLRKCVGAMLGLAGSALLPSSSTVATPTMSNTVFVTCANSTFLPSLLTFLQAISGQVSQFPTMSCRIYFMSDVADSVIAEFEKKHPYCKGLRLPTETLPGFSDCWAPEHYFWKLWILHTTVHDASIAGRPVLYMDAGTVLCRYPHVWMASAMKHGMSVLEDHEQDNASWCHHAFRDALQVTAEELRSQQIWAGSMAFVAGHPLAVQVLDASYTWGQRRAVIQGVKWATAEEKPYGHRHDQSILSILTQRMKVPRLPLYDFYCHISLRHTYLTGGSIYTHRGNFKTHVPVTVGIDDVFVINLDRRKDRLDKWKKTHPSIVNRMLRLPAFDGKALQLTPAITRLFAPNDFKWKKSVMGCALSHLALWHQLVNEKPDVNSYLVLEDDAVLAPDWMERWNDSYSSLPDGWDVVYLGGILPPNRDAFDTMAIEQITSRVGRIKMNSIFGQRPANRYFHFCAYSYVITKAGAMKVLEVLKSRGGYWTSADHMMCNIHTILNISFLTPLVAGCYQDNDPVYKNSQFNDFSRVDTFDSDLWNNVEEFTEEEVGAMRSTQTLSIADALVDARRVCAASASASTVSTVSTVSTASTVSTVSSTVSSSAAVSSSVSTVSSTGPAPSSQKRRIVAPFPIQMSASLCEYKWLHELFGSSSELVCELVDINCAPTDSPILVLQSPHQSLCIELMKRWASAGLTFYVLHLSDENLIDPIHFYQWAQCLGVVRMYPRPDCMGNPKVATIPLGYACKSLQGNYDSPRKLLWSFTGTGWHGRRENLEHLRTSEPNVLALQDEWLSPARLTPDATIALLESSEFVPCPRGGNTETFRFYEALEAGAVPILVKENGCDLYYAFVTLWIPILIVGEWKDVPAFMKQLMQRPEKLSSYKADLRKGWKKMREDAAENVRRVFALV